MGQGTGNGKRHRGGKLYRCRAPVAVETDYGPSTGTCGAWLHRAYITKGGARHPVAIGWYCEGCGAFIRGDDPLAGVELEGSTRYNDADQIMAEFFRRTCVHIWAPVPGTALVGIDVPRREPRPVLLGEVLRPTWDGPYPPLTLPIGVDAVGVPVLADLALMPPTTMVYAQSSARDLREAVDKLETDW